MRVIIFTGKGGSGVSTLAAGTAAAIAGGGRRTLAFGLGPGLAAAFDHALGAHPVPLAADLWAMEAVPGRHDEPGPFLAWLRDLFAYRDLDETVADHVAALPGLVDLARLLTLEEHVESGEYEVVVVDGPAARHALDLLAALDAAARSLDRMFPERQPTVLEPFLRALGGGAISGEDVYEAGRGLLERLAALRRALWDPDIASVRLVLTAEEGWRTEAKRAVTGLSLFAYPLDVAICNRLLPEDAGPWSSGRRRAQQEALRGLMDDLAPLPVLSVALQPLDVSGLREVTELAGTAYAGADPAALIHRGPSQKFSRRDGSYVLSLALPFVERDDLALERVDDSLIVHVGERSRTFDLPAEADGYESVSSAFDGETLRVTFSQKR